jgi:predicted  nucleic acid-binding Zn-ribbon protein
MAKLKSELDVACPYCGALLLVDANLGRVISHQEPEREDKPDLDAAERILAEGKAKREAAFLQSVEAEKTRGDALSKRFEEALRQARQEPVGPPPKREFELD